jgi:Tfp pilus assembly protein PilF
MKKQKRQRLRLKPLAQTSKQTAASEPEKAPNMRWVGALAGIGVLLVIGYFVFYKEPPPIRSHSTVATRTNNTVAAQASQPPGSGEVDSLEGHTNRPGASVNREKEGNADDLNNQGIKMLEQGDPKQAVLILQKALALKPEDETFHFNLGVAWAKAGDATNAEHEYQEALRLLPDYPEAHNNYGNLLAKDGRLDEAEQQIKAASTAMPESAEYHNNLGVLEQRLKKTNDALLCFQKAVECDSNYLEGHFNLAQAYVARQQREKAMAQLLEALRIKPGFAPARNALTRLTSAP